MALSFATFFCCCHSRDAHLVLYMGNRSGVSYMEISPAMDPFIILRMMLVSL